MSAQTQTLPDSLAEQTAPLLSFPGPDTAHDTGLASSARMRLLAPPFPFEEYDPLDTKLRWGRAAIVGGALGGLVTGIHIYQANAWWSDNRGPFRFINDSEYALNVDKAGHFVGGTFASFIGRKSLEWSGFSRNASLWGGFTMASLFSLYVEFEDGFAQDWGFSIGDAAGGIIGAFWPVMQVYVPGVEHFQPKFSYWPSTEILGGEHKGNAIDDYEGQTYWMGVHVHGLLPESWQRWWPEWLGFAVGVSVRNMATYENLERNIIIALDYDMTRIIPGDSWFMQTFKEALNFIRFPSPAIRISPNFVSYGLYF
jgi:hypothetical protein